ncbi:hypothetical protein K3495_g1808 [Podosphaera aphanis]|nr:hypothetical protein K3495_g1808 [Podosphaera aphanis]
MALPWSYKYNEVTEIGWISGSNDSADAVTKEQSCDALKKLLDENNVDISANSRMEIDVENKH